MIESTRGVGAIPKQTSVDVLHYPQGKQRRKITFTCNQFTIRNLECGSVVPPITSWESFQWVAGFSSAKNNKSQITRKVLQEKNELYWEEIIFSKCFTTGMEKWIQSMSANSWAWHWCCFPSCFSSFFLPSPLLSPLPFLSSYLSFFFLSLSSSLPLFLLIPQPGIEPGSQQWKHRVLTTRPPGNSHPLLS